MTPEFAEFLLQTPADQRHDYVFKLTGLRTGEQMTSARAGRIILEIGALADMLVHKVAGK
jgi:hypothetical protein